MQDLFGSIHRPYKECTAEQTIEQIKAILQGLGLQPIETFTANPYPEIYSLSLELPASAGSFRANGKGRTRQYALASGYAEFMERMQNLAYATYSRSLMADIREQHGFYYSPDERYLTREEFLALPKEIIADFVYHSGENRARFISAYFERLAANGLPGVVALPFYDTRRDCPAYLPFNLLLLAAGSNGMAAGNTVAEATFQALCELLERWGAALVFYERLTPPSAPDDYLRSFAAEYAIIAEIERSGKYRVTVKDFSAGRGIPSLGIIIQNLEAGTYRLNVGSDTSFQVALSRCLTEVYQGMQDTEQFDAKLLPIPQEELSCFSRSDEAAVYERFITFSAFTRDGTGLFPPNLFADEPDYTFDPGVFQPGDSFEQEVADLLSFFHGDGRDVYIRDVSFLGFPSVFVYVPEVSALGRKSAQSESPVESFRMIELDVVEPLVFRLAACSDEELLRVAQALENLDGSIFVTDLFNVKLRNESPWRQLSVAFLQTQIWYRLGNLENAVRWFERFLDTRSDDHKYYEIVHQYLRLKATGHSEQEMFCEIVHDTETEAVARTVFADLADPGQVFRFLKLPQCPECSTCDLAQDCLTRGSLAITHRIYPEMRRNHSV